jgi:RNA polymerase-binding transcription factor DksA
MTTHTSTHSASEIRRVLDEAAATRQRHLDRLPPAEGDLVAEAHRASVERILGDIRAALDRLASGTYGVCQGCRDRIPAERIRLRPWTPYCVRCATL